MHKFLVSLFLDAAMLAKLSAVVYVVRMWFSLYSVSVCACV